MRTSPSFAQERRAAPGNAPDAEHNWFLGVLFPASQLHILPYNRVVTDLSAHTPAAFLHAVRAAGFVVEERVR